MRKSRQDIIDRIQELEGGAAEGEPDVLAGDDVSSLVRTLSERQEENPIVAGSRAVTNALRTRAGLTALKTEKADTGVSALLNTLLREKLVRVRPEKKPTSLETTREELVRRQIAELERTGETGFSTIEEVKKFAEELGQPIASARREKGRILARFGKTSSFEDILRSLSEPSATTNNLEPRRMPLYLRLRLV